MKAPLGISYEIRLHSALMLPLLVNFSYIRLHSACMLPLLGNFFYIRLDSARMLPLLVNFSYIRLHSARMLPLLVNFSYIRLHSVLMLPLLVNFSYIRLHSALIIFTHFDDWIIPSTQKTNTSPLFEINHQKSNFSLNSDTFSAPMIDILLLNCSDLLWEKIVQIIEKNFWNSRLKVKNLQNFWDH